ncbi:MAG: TM0106 family RecB-like putative nuclease [Arthrobacter sp.]|uniref:TM0106 family RecB-like putative nuclease n=1 Tax=Arthrobacter sp. TaxID=1667 RepID=UPI00349109A1
MFLLDSATPGAPRDLVYSASDLVVASECEFQALFTLDVLLGLRPKPEFDADEMLVRAAALGEAHEARVLAGLTARFGPWDARAGTGVVTIERPDDRGRAALAERHGQTLDALRAGADVVFQATFFDGAFVGFADFIVRQPDGRYAVWDSKLARHAKVTALLQLAAYGDQLLADGFAPSDEATLVLGDLRHSVHPLPDLLPVYRERRDRFLALVGGHRAGGRPVEWGGKDITACGRCDYCAVEVAAHRDLLLVAGMSLGQRKKLRGRRPAVTTIDQLADLPADQARGPLARLRDQARLQTGADRGDGTAPGDAGLAYKVLAGHTIGLLPAPSPGDVFFDFEGDPLWQDPADGSWGLEYLFGVVEHDAGAPVFVPFWAHTRAEEKRAFLDFVAYVEERRKAWPDLHVYHYASYEKTALRNLSVRHTAAEETVDGWLRDGLLVDLLDTVRHSLRISADSYSIKKLEPFYMTSGPREGDVTNAGASVVAYARYAAARDAGDATAAADVLASISAYNEYDCVSTLRLRDWLAGLGAARADEGERAPARLPRPEETPDEDPLPEEIRLREYLDALPETPSPDTELGRDQRAVAMVSAATGYHRRERKQFWWEHFDRLGKDTEQWQDTRNVVLVHEAAVVEDWHKPTGRAQTLTRRLRLAGTAAEGSDLREGSTWFAMYGPPVPAGMETEGHRGGSFNTLVEAVGPSGDADGVVLHVAERTRRGQDPYPQLPLALTPDQPIATKSIEAALKELARTVGGALPTLPRHAGLDILRRRPPSLRGGAALPPVPTDASGQHDYIGAITAAVADLDRSYLAVQGPPGTGKTHVGAHVIHRLVRRGWKVGVVSQGHSTIEHLLAKSLEAGLDPELVAKEPKSGDTGAKPWTHTTKKALGALLSAPGGCLVGGTAWTMTGANVPAGSLDLLVIDEAGQYSLANTLAVARAARNLLLLGDPQQLPQVTQGTHPEPVDESALGWLSAGHPTLPGHLGYFLADSWRMHPALCSRVSRLSYDGKLESAPAARLRRLDGVPAGVETVMVEHRGNTTSSSEEAAEVVDQVRRHLGLSWDDGSGRARPLVDADVLVVAAYNAQVNLIRSELARAGLGGTRVGTVDKFQGQQAPVVVVSMACSAAAEAPRGMEFLLNRNRVNVAVSRGQWRAVIVRSPELTHHLPGRPDGLAELGAFVGLCANGAAAMA